LAVGVKPLAGRQFVADGDNFGAHLWLVPIQCRRLASASMFVVNKRSVTNLAQWRLTARHRFDA
jgi:hypothetical protein